MQTAPQPHTEPLQQAIAAHRSGQLEHAAQLYTQLLDDQPAHADALHYQGILLHQRGNSAAAVASITQALTLAPAQPDACNNLGNVHRECGRLRDAEHCYRRALALAPAHADALANLAAVLEAQRRSEEAFVTYAALLHTYPQSAHAHYLLGLFLRNNAQAAEHLQQSVQCLQQACTLAPDHLHAREALGTGLYLLGEHAQAQTVYRDWLTLEPGNPVATHMLAACGGAEPPPRAGDTYVRELFDGFADSFDEQLLHHLEYRAPQRLTKALAACLAPPHAGLRMLDAGCGTGLCAPLWRPYAHQLVGVDLSPGMVAKARQRGGYDRLEVAELTAYLHAQHAQWDVIGSADTLVYFGALQPVLAAAAGALTPGGVLGFTVEALDEPDDRVELDASGRYRHSHAHVRAALQGAGLQPIALELDVLRSERGQPVHGWVVTARTPGPA
ncbi:tetratricopeptide repeat protein [Xanthomonas perforans]|uniref:tetratricopeptide repeat protein n=1 Tax=Xanthomonas perforans TaxID=442694 RepID=UPI001DA2B06A|nr:tetratricopeptide repeat protein [Xanthomonas perforans]MBZ2804890.1 tetratricopeptide repeat protein [Xanthomonas perforans]MBZ3234090.1 tetratricopeptide repeat protein [Xanthomonas perforans]MBZ3236974.1 tetratricopeptide repeat protein [Xanthomonas perforans]MBZ3458498.1 tetratricopeptide repeat protein [Xanthomonas perforans]MBZ3493294.1 tetratricopeptide repeat protein [Xanthomonas perforans]